MLPGKTEKHDNRTFYMLCNGLSQFKQLLLDFFNIPEFVIDISLMYTAQRFSTNIDKFCGTVFQILRLTVANFSNSMAHCGSHFRVNCAKFGPVIKVALEESGTGHCSDRHCSNKHCSDRQYSDRHCSDRHCSDKRYPWAL